MGLFSKKEKTPAETLLTDVCRVKKNETVLIIANPETAPIAQELFSAAYTAGARPSLIFQQKKTSNDYAEKAVIAALSSAPDVVLSISSAKLGRDEEAIATPYKDEAGISYDSVFDYLLMGKKTIRAVWSPGLTNDMFKRTVCIDYKQLSERCEKICKKYEGVVSVHVTSPNGTDVTVPVQGRKALVDDGNFSEPGSGGNIPTGEVFISPVVGSGNKSILQTDAKKITSLKDVFASVTGLDLEKNAVGEQKSAESTGEPEHTGTNGTIVFDGSMTFSDADALLETPITVRVKDGFVEDISGGEEAKRLQKDILAAEKESLALEAAEKLPAGLGAVYARNARNIGELGIGLNPAANITGNMLEDEKAFRTCHFAIGQNYDGDAPALIHFDGVVRNPTIVFTYQDGSQYTLLEKGDLKLT